MGGKSRGHNSVWNLKKQQQSPSKFLIYQILAHYGVGCAVMYMYVCVLLLQRGNIHNTTLHDKVPKIWHFQSLCQNYTLTT